jgi:hypothetical protein
MTHPTTPKANKELREFLKTLKIHNKDLDVCFNDAVAVGHLEALLTSDKQKLLQEIMEQAIQGYPVLRATGKFRVVPLSVIQNKLEGLS